MTGFSFAPKLPHFAAIITFLLAVCLQTQVTLGKSDFSLGLRLAASDLLLIPLGVFILMRLVRHQALWPRWCVPRTDLWVAGLTLLMLAAFVWGYFYTGYWSNWAFYNRMIGWGALMAYFYAGAWLMTNYGTALLLPFLRIFAGFCVAAGVLGLAQQLFVDFDVMLDILVMPYGQITGFVVNRNAYAFSYLAALAIIGVGILRNADIFNTRITQIIFALTPFMLIYNGSRALWGIFLILMLVFAALNFRLWAQTILVPIIIGALICGAYFNAKNQSIFREGQMDRLEQTINAVALAKMSRDMHPSETYRAFVTRTALEEWQKSPVVGIGIGSYLTLQNLKYGSLIEMIDSTPLWLLVETGLIGLAAFGVFGLRLAYAQKARVQAGSVLAACGWMFLCIFGAFFIMSLVHQLLYTRFLWVFMGLAAAIPAQNQK